MKAKQLLFLFSALAFSYTINAQDYNPYKDIGKKGKVLTLSKGKYVEFFDMDTIQRIGTVMYNIRTKKIVKLLNPETVYKKASNNTSSSRWYSPDPLADKFASFTPYNFVENNPLNMIDPDGREASPIYDNVTGAFLGTDDQGFSGDILFTSSEIYHNILSPLGTTATHSMAEAFSSKIDGMLANPSQQRVDAVTNAINDVVSKTENKGFAMSELHNGKVSSYYYGGKDANNVVALNNNDGSPIGLKVPASSSPTKDANGQSKITFNLSPSSIIARTDNGKNQGTVENVQNTAMHEKGHIKDKAPGNGTAHAKAYEIQMKHPSFQKVTPEFRKQVIEAYNDVKAGKL
jgi:hypothetical protein